MRDSDTSAIIVTEGGEVRGLITDHDIVVRVIAEGTDPSRVQAADVCSADVVTLSPGDSVERAIELMRGYAVRRLPVVEGGRPVGILSLGDLAIEHDEESALADISAAGPDV